MSDSTQLAPVRMQQADFPLIVPVCAWCKPKPGAAVLPIISHGICPRHLRAMRSKAARRTSRR